MCLSYHKCRQKVKRPPKNISKIFQKYLHKLILLFVCKHWTSDLNTTQLNVPRFFTFNGFSFRFLIVFMNFQLFGDLDLLKFYNPITTAILKHSSSRVIKVFFSLLDKSMTLLNPWYLHCNPETRVAMLDCNPRNAI